jgi:hypothetical protein
MRGSLALRCPVVTAAARRTGSGVAQGDAGAANAARMSESAGAKARSLSQVVGSSGPGWEEERRLKPPPTR